MEKHGEDAIRSACALNHPHHAQLLRRFHFDALAHDNSAHESAVKKVYNVPIEQEDAHTNRPLALVGTQYIHKKRGAPPDEVRIAMCLFPVRKRINEHEVIDNDLVVTFNVPIQSADGRAAGEEGWVKSEQDFNALATSLRILDHGLFVPKAVEHW